LPAPGQPLTAVNVNSGYCYPGKVIVVYRQEEWRRTLFHECIHFLHLTDKIDKVRFPPHILVQEAHCEVMARFLVCCIRQGDLMALVEAERDFSLYQMVKVLDHHGLTYADIGRLPPQKTQAYAYYVVSAILLNTFDYLRACPDLRASTSLVPLFTTIHPDLTPMTRLFQADKRRRSWWYRTLRFTSI
jgi:hypothetical protein